MKPRAGEGDKAIAHDPHISGVVKSRTGLNHIFREIRHDVEKAGSRPALTELSKRAGSLATLTYEAPHVLASGSRRNCFSEKP
jgi:hypothetical protein